MLRDNLKLEQEFDSVWFDEDELRGGSDLTEDIKRAIEACDCLLFLMTPDSVLRSSYCTKEWQWAESHYKLIVPIKVIANVELPFGFPPDVLMVDISEGFHVGFPRLKELLFWWKTWKGKVHRMKGQIDALKRFINNVPSTDSIKPKVLITSLSSEINELETILTHLHDVSKHGLPDINAPTFQPPRPLHGYDEKLTLGTEALKDKTKRLLLILGRPGVGKTSLAYRLLEDIKKETFGDHSSAQSFAQVVYFNSNDVKELSLSKIFLVLSQILDKKEKESLKELYKDPGIKVLEKTKKLLEFLPVRRVVVLFDGIEELLDPATGAFKDDELEQTFYAFLEYPLPTLKIILTSQVSPKKLLDIQAQSQCPIDLKDGLTVSDAENMLCDMDHDGSLRLKGRSNEVFAQIHELTQGNPEALVKFVTILRKNPSLTVEEVMGKEGRQAGAEISKILSEKLFDQLKPKERKIVQVLAAFDRPVISEGVNYVIEKYESTGDSDAELRHLVDMKLVQKNHGGYFLQKNDQLYALSRMSDEPNIHSLQCTMLALKHQASEFYRSIRKPIDECHSIEDMDSQLAEFELREEAQEYDAAMTILEDIRKPMLTWGHYEEMAKRYERICEKLVNAQLKDQALRVLGWIYQKQGKLKEALSCYQDGLKVCEETNNQNQQAIFLNNIAICLEEQGKVALAMIHSELSLRISEGLEDHSQKAHVLNTLSDCAVSVGLIREAIGYCQLSREISRECRNKNLEALSLVNLGRQYVELGENQAALARIKEGYSLASRESYDFAESWALTALGEAHLCTRNFLQAVEFLDQAVSLADKVQSSQIQQMSRVLRASAKLSLGKFSDARADIDEANQYELPSTAYEICGVLGVIALRQGERGSAKYAFQEAKTSAQQLLELNPQDYRILYFKGLALAGLVVCEEAAEEYVPLSVQAFNEASQATKAVGTLNKVRWLVEGLEKSDQENKLVSVKDLAGAVFT